MIDAKSTAHDAGRGFGREDILRELLQYFAELLKVSYGPIGYLTMSDGESTRHLYNVDTDIDYYAMVDGARIRISSKRLEGMVFAAGGKRLPLIEEGEMIDDPAETPSNKKFADEAIKEIMDSIGDMLRDN